MNIPRTSPIADFRHLETTEPVSFHVGGRGDMAFSAPVAGRVDGHTITAHDYGQGRELECDCPAVTGCWHIAALESALAVAQEVAA